MPNQPKGIEELKKWFEANYLDGDSVQKGQMLSSEVCLEALETYAKQEVEKLFEEMIGFTFEACPYGGTMMRAFINSKALLAEKDIGETDRPINNERE